MLDTFGRLCERARRRSGAAVWRLAATEITSVAAAGALVRLRGAPASVAAWVSAGRRLRRRPGYSVAVVATLALGVAASTAVVSVVTTVLLRELPFPDAEGLSHAMSVQPGGSPGEATFGVDPASFLVWRSVDDLFRGVEGVHRDVRVVTGDEGPPEQLPSAIVTPELFSLLGVRPVLGRLFAEPEGRPGDQDHVLIGAELWSRRFGSDPGVVGRRITLDGVPTTVVGVMPARFAFPESGTQLWLPVAPTAAALAPLPGSSRVPALDVIAALRPGLTRDDANARLTERAEALVAAGASRVPVLFDMEFFATPAQTRRVLLIAGGAVLLVLLTATGNVVSLGLSQAFDRRRELAMRVALGASRARLAGDSFAENLLLAAAGSALGLGAAYLLLANLLPLLPAQLQINTWGHELGVWPHGWLFAGLATVATASVVTSLTHLGTDRAVPSEQLAGSTATASGEKLRAQQALLGAQMALAVILLAGAGLMAATVGGLARVDTGYDVDRLLVASLRVPTDDMMDAQGDAAARAAAMDARFRELESALARVPGVRSLAVTTSPIPLTRARFRPVFETPEGGPIETLADDTSAPMPVRAAAMFVPTSDVTPGFFEATGIELVAGRGFTDADDPSASAVVNDVLARRLWPEGAAVGRQFRVGPRDPWMTVVGVAAPAAQMDLRDQRGDGAEFYVPLDRTRFGVYRTFVLRTDGEPAQLVEPVRRAVWAVDPHQPIERLLPLADAFGETLHRERFLLLLITCFAAIATTLAAIGTYALLSRALARRTRELGIRVALGASPARVAGRLARAGVAPAATGIALGLAIAWYLTGLLESLLFGVRPGDPVALAAAAALLLGLAAVASLVPARRALGLDVVAAIRRE